MSRPLRIRAAGGLYHVMSRGNAKATIFLDDVDRVRFLTTLATTVERCQLEVHAYCLMSNHYHLVVRTPEGDLSSGIQYVNGVYAQWWNRRHSRVGHVLQGRFKAQLIQRDGYFLEACRYVVLNPVRAGLADRAEEWNWSSYRSTAGLVPKPWWLTTTLVLGARSADGAQAYRAFIAEGITEDLVTRAIRADVPVIGDVSFVAAHRDAIERAHPIEVLRRARVVGRPTLASLFADVPDRATRDTRIQEARDRFLYRVSEISRHVSLHYATVSRIAAGARPPRASAPSDCAAERPGRCKPSSEFGD
jgi:REP element-mobilizing transposase RayT